MDQPPVDNQSEFEVHPQMLLDKDGEKMTAIVKATFLLPPKMEWRGCWFAMPSMPLLVPYMSPKSEEPMLVRLAVYPPAPRSKLGLAMSKLRLPWVLKLFLEEENWPNE